MGCSVAKSLPRPRHDSKASTKSSHELSEEAYMNDLLLRSAFFNGLTKEDAAKMVQKGTIAQDGGGTRLVVESRHQFLLGGVALVTVESQSFVSKRRDIYGEDCFVHPSQSGIFSIRRRDRRDSRASRRDSQSRESFSRDRRESIENLVGGRREGGNRERVPSRDDEEGGDVALKLTKLERRPLAIFARKDIEALAETSESLKALLPILENRARLRSFSGFSKSGCLSVLRPTELKNFALGFDWCTLEAMTNHFATRASSGNFYYICDGSVDIVATLQNPLASSDNEGDEDVAPIRQVVGKLEGGSFVSETSGLLQTQKRYANKLTYSVCRPGTALYISAAHLQNYTNFVFSESTKQNLLSEARAREPKYVRRFFQVFQYLSDESLEFLMEACESVNLFPGEEVPRQGDFHLVRSGGVTTAGTIRRRSIGGNLYVSNGSTSDVPAPTAATGASGTASSIARQGDFFSQEGMVKIFNARREKQNQELIQSFGLPSMLKLSMEDTSSPGQPPATSMMATDEPAARDNSTNVSEPFPATVNGSATDDQQQRTSSALPDQLSSQLSPSSGSMSPPSPTNRAHEIPAMRAATADTIIWTFPAELVASIMQREPLWEVDVEIRALKENATVEAILKHPVACYHFRNNLAAFHAEENLDFYLAVCAFQQSSANSPPPSFVTSNSMGSSPPPHSTSSLSPLAGFTRQFGGKLTRSFSQQSNSGASQQHQSNPRETNSGGGGGGQPSPCHTPEPPGDELCTGDAMALALLQEFVEENAPRQVNIASSLRDQIKESVCGHSIVARTVFNQAQQECLKILMTDGFPRFRNSKAFEEMLRDVCTGVTLQDIISGQDSSKNPAQVRASPLSIAKRRLSGARTSSSSKPTRELGSPAYARMSWEMIDWASGATGLDSSRRPKRADDSPRAREDSRESYDSHSKRGRKSVEGPDLRRVKSGEVSPRAFSSPTESNRKRHDPGLGTISEASPTSVPTQILSSPERKNSKEMSKTKKSPQTPKKSIL